MVKIVQTNVVPGMETHSRSAYAGGIDRYRARAGLNDSGGNLLIAISVESSLFQLGTRMKLYRASK